MTDKPKRGRRTKQEMNKINIKVVKIFYVQQLKDYLCKEH